MLDIAEYRKLRLFSISHDDYDGLTAFARDIGIRGVELATVQAMPWHEDIKAYLYAAIRVRSCR
jgi:hypothetical protein